MKRYVRFESRELKAMPEHGANLKQLGAITLACFTVGGVFALGAGIYDNYRAQKVKYSQAIEQAENLERQGQSNLAERVRDKAELDLSRSGL